jgi:predicted alpha/beta superfamily hydrolase
MRSIKALIIIVFITAVSYAQNNIDELVLGEYIKIYSKVLSEERRIFIRLPFGYEQSSEKYPVLLVLDEHAHSIHASGTVSFLSGNGAIPQTIVISIPNTDRQRDFTPTKTDVVPNGGGADNFIKFLKDELIPYVDKN